MFERVSSSTWIEQHKETVKSISEKVAQFYASKTPFRIYHGSTNSTRPSLRQRDRMVDTSTLDRVLHVDEQSKTALVEPNVPMDRLLDSTLKQGLCPKVVMEFPGITAGGAFAGIGGESSSFKHGYFDASVRQIELVLGDGTVTVAAADPDGPNHDLFKGTAGTMGTLGVVTGLEVELVDAGKYVDLTYHSVYSSDEAVAKVMQETRAEARNDFVDGIMFARDKGVVLSGRFSSPSATKPSFPIARFARARDNWFYLHVEEQFCPASLSNSSEPTKLAPTFSTPLRDYLFRYDRGAFWMARHAFRYFSFTPFDRLSRFVLDPLLHTRTLYRAMHYAGHYDWYLIQDLGLPVDKAAAFIDYVDEKLDIWPLWLCPLRCGWGTRWLRPNQSTGAARFSYPAADESEEGDDTRPWEHPGEREMVFNVGCWGPIPNSSRYHAPDPEDLVAYNRAIEAEVARLGGIKWPYSQYFYAEDEFWQIYDRDAYEALRSKYRATTLPSMWEKVRPHLGDGDGKVEVRKGPPNGSSGLHGWLVRKLWNVWPVSGAYAVLKVILSRRRYLIERNGEEKRGKEKGE